ncbi:interferon-induced helicase C domain-containing protein 1 [Takifugu flavidus]|uniref:interferon-induced helicase C domain-containing protein 1 n=1 Tax=Takifugu flavidus TaxID=433684 RepID=UPI00254404E5|nr:interferon-induced helicase C domain-containing protein 1 [Takifugu flavidus]
MAADSDEMHERLIEYFQPRLRNLIAVQQVLDLLDFVTPDQKERIRQKNTNEGNRAAADALVAAVIQKPHQAGWFRAFVDALEGSGCGYAADYIQNKIPEPEVETENDNCVRLIQILSPSLVDMKVAEVRVHCLSQELITQDDSEIIAAATRNHGAKTGARELLGRIVRGRPGWFSKFLSILLETQHTKLYFELTGGSPDCDKQGNEAATEVSQEAGDCCSVPESNEPADKEDGAQCAGAARDGEADDITLRDYQMKVVRPALEGKNIIICLPTGWGKTRAAVYVAKKHLDSRKAAGQTGKVAVLVNKIPLVEQHYSAEFLPFLKPMYKVERVSGASLLKISFVDTLRKNDVIICTAQILENYLDRSRTGEDEGVNLSDLSLIIVDECHHTQKEGVYNEIMVRYLKQKIKNAKLKKEQKPTVPLPQILGLTASPGVGGATKLDKAVEHILRICANLDASKIMTLPPDQLKRDSKKTVKPVEDRKEDPFGDVIKKIMNAIHYHAQLKPNGDLGSQIYEQWVVQMERKAVLEGDHKVRACAEHLRQYNEGLGLSNTIRMWDALNFLNKYHEEEMKNKTTPDEEQVIQITDTERFLFNLFKEYKEELHKLANNPDYENKSLSILRTKILQEFSTRQDARGIVFTKTRRGAIALTQWIQENPKFADLDVKAAYVIGGGDQSVVKPMTAAEQKDVLTKFRSGEVNLLIATSVAEEGLDIPKCNFVIRYGHVGNEISMIQTEGRGRAEDSTHTVVDVKDSGVAEKECVNEYRKDMMNKAIDKIGALKQDAYDKKIQEFQIQAIMEYRLRMKMKQKADIKNEDPSEVKFSCRGCSQEVCTGEDIEVIEDIHRVNVTPQFRELFIRKESTKRKDSLLDYETNGYIVCGKCGQRWGSMMYFRGIQCPSLHVKNFVVAISGKNMPKCSKWTDVPARFSAFDYVAHADQLVESSDEEDA